MPPGSIIRPTDTGSQPKARWRMSGSMMTVPKRAIIAIAIMMTDTVNGWLVKVRRSRNAAPLPCSTNWRAMNASSEPTPTPMASIGTQKATSSAPTTLSP